MSYPYHITGQKIVEPQIYFVAPDLEYARPHIMVMLRYKFRAKTYKVSKSFPTSVDNYDLDIEKARGLRKYMQDLCTEAIISREQIPQEQVDNAYKRVCDAPAKRMHAVRGANARRNARNDVSAVWLRYGPVDHIAKSHYKQYQWIAS